MSSLDLDDAGRRRVHAALETLDGCDVRSKLIQKLASPIELHQFVLNYNWDDGDEAIVDILNHPRLDRGTALHLYWTSGPMLLQYDRDWWDMPYCNGGKLYDRLVQTEQELLNYSHLTELICIDPHNILESDYTVPSLDIPFTRDPIPELCQPSPGVIVERDDLQYELTEEEIAQREAEDTRSWYEHLLEMTRHDRGLLDNALAYHRKYYPNEPFEPPPPAPELLWTDEERQAHENAENQRMFKSLMDSAERNPAMLDNAKAFHQKYFPNEIFPNILFE